MATVDDWIDACRRQGITLRRRGQEHCGPCPICQTGDDRFWIKPRRVQPVARCRYGHTYRQLHRALLGDSFDTRVRPRRRRPAPRAAELADPTLSDQARRARRLFAVAHRGQPTYFRRKFPESDRLVWTHRDMWLVPLKPFAGGQLLPGVADAQFILPDGAKRFQHDLLQTRSPACRSRISGRTSRPSVQQWPSGTATLRRSHSWPEPSWMRHQPGRSTGRSGSRHGSRLRPRRLSGSTLKSPRRPWPSPRRGGGPRKPGSGAAGGARRRPARTYPRTRRDLLPRPEERSPSPRCRELLADRKRSGSSSRHPVRLRRRRPVGVAAELADPTLSDQARRARRLFAVAHRGQPTYFRRKFPEFDRLVWTHRDMWLGPLKRFASGQSAPPASPTPSSSYPTAPSAFSATCGSPDSRPRPAGARRDRSCSPRA